MHRTALTRLALPLVLSALVLAGPGCGGGDDASSGKSESAKSTFTYEFPPDVPFDPAEWTTNTDFEPLGSPNAKRDMQDRPFTIPVQEFPATLRRQGPNGNTTTNATLHSLQYETLVGLHPETEEYVPGLASHWKVETDEETGIQTFWFHIDERAKWADGTPVTAADVHATWWHRTQEDRKDPMSMMTYSENYEEPVIIDRAAGDIQADLSDPNDTAAALEAALAAGPITRLVNNVGIVLPAAVEDQSLAELDLAVSLNLRCALQCMQALLPGMRAAGFGRVVNMASRAAYGKELRSAYSATKAGLIGMTRTWALELGPDGITVNAVAPGPIRTALFDHANPPDAPRTQAIMQAIPVKRIGTPEDVAHAVSFLLDERAGFVTGQVVPVCGGITVGSGSA